MAARTKEFPEIVRIPREDFIRDYWDYRKGEHVTFIAPTGNGKTTLALQLLENTAHEDLPAVVLVMKPRDETVDKFSKRVEYRKVNSWPPVKSPWKPRKPDGYIVWPKHNLRNPRETNEMLSDVFYETIVDSYAKGNRIIFADELYSLDEELGLDTELITVWTKGRSMGTGLWGATQKPTHVPLWAYSQASHLFLSYDPDERARKRYGEIGGMNPELIVHATEQLEEYEWVYIKPAGRKSTICIVGA